MEELPACVHSPVEVTRVQWVSDAFRRHIPPAPLFHRWRLEVDFVRGGGALRFAAMLRGRSSLSYSRELEHGPAAERLRYGIRVDPYDWDNGDEVQIGIEGMRKAVVSRRLKVAPQEAVQPLLKVGERLLTGHVVDVARFVDLGLVAQVALIAVEDVKKDRTRWRIRSQTPEGDPYSFLWTGHRSGDVRLEGGTGAG